MNDMHHRQDPAAGAPGTRRGFGRRTLFTGLAGAAGLGVIGAGAVGIDALVGDDESARLRGAETTDFYGEHQAGITTAPTSHISYVGLDLVDGADADVLAGILGIWTEDAARLTAGRAALVDTEPELATMPSRLTVNVGLGAGAFDATGLLSRRPSWLRPLPEFTIDRLDPRWGQTDLLLSIGSDDLQTVAHATRVLTANVRSRVRVRWVQRGFREARGSTPEGTTMRNLMGQVDGTVNPALDDHATLIWDDGSEQPWMRGGTSMVLRRIEMDLDGWQELDPHGRELSVGRRLATGAPLTGTHERDEPDFAATRAGIPIIPPSSHIARAHRQQPHEQFLRKAYNYDDPPEPGAVSTSNSGLLFAAYQRDIDRQFVPVQQRLADHDALNEWTFPIGSAVYAILPGVEQGQTLGQGMFEQA